MALTAAQICAAARNRAKAPGYQAASGQYLNLTLQEFCLTGDFDLAKGTFNFNFSPATAPIGNLNAQLASGPFTLPPDYLRAKKGDIMWFLNNFPKELIPFDLEEFDALANQMGMQTFPTVFATDVSLRRDVLTTKGDSTPGSGVFANVGNFVGVSVGQGVYGPAIKTGSLTQVTAFDVNAKTITVAPASNVIAGGFGWGLTFAVCPIAYVWPPAVAASPCMVRYYRQMPDIAAAESSSEIPWFPYQDLLIDGTAGRLMKDTGDDRWEEFLGEDRPDSVPTRLRKYLQLKDDRSNRSQRVTLERRRFGPGRAALPQSKIFGI